MMEKDRLAAFSDGVIAIIITIMVLELKIPVSSYFSGLEELAPTLLSYALSFLYVAIYWNNHHHMFQTVHQVNGLILWTNAHLLFWLSLIPFATAWVGTNHHATAPTAVYGIVLILSALAYTLLQKAIISSQGHHSLLAKAVGKDWKGKISLILYLTAIAMAFLQPWVSHSLYACVACLWLVPDRRIEKTIKEIR